MRRLSLIFVTNHVDNAFWVLPCLCNLDDIKAVTIMLGQCDNHSRAALAGLVLSASLAVLALPARAVTLGDIPFVQTTTVEPGSFSESLVFDVLSEGTTFASVQSFDMTAGSSFLLHIPSLDVSLHDAGGTMLASVSGSPVSFASAIGAGTYRLDIGGVATGLSGGFFTVGLSAVASPVVPVPEPGVWMTLAGGLAVLVALRRSRRSLR